MVKAFPTGRTTLPVQVYDADTYTRISRHYGWRDLPLRSRPPSPMEACRQYLRDLVRFGRVREQALYCAGEPKLTQLAKNILFFGFSVTEQKSGFARILADRLSNEDLNVNCVVRGFGGMHPPDANHLFEKLVPPGQFDVVVFDITTTAFRDDVNHRYQKGTDDARDGFALPVVQLIAKAFQRGAKVIVVNLPRRDVDYNDDQFSAVCKNICASCDIPFIDLALRLQIDGEIQSLLVDEVHTTEAGSQKLAAMLYEPLTDAIRDDTASHTEAICAEIAGYSSSLSFVDVTSPSKTGHFHRSTDIDFIEVDADASITIVMPHVVYLAGISYIMGPLSGDLLISIDGAPSELRINAHDEHCYYERLHATMFDEPLIVNATLSIRQDNNLPAVTLKKGEPNLSSRVGKLCHLLVTNGPNDGWKSSIEYLWH